MHIIKTCHDLECIDLYGLMHTAPPRARDAHTCFRGHDVVALQGVMQKPAASESSIVSQN